MKVGVVFPTRDIPPRSAAINSFAHTLEDLGYQHLWAYDHVLGVDPVSNPDWNGTFAPDDPFHEPIVLLSYLASVCRLELVTGVLVLPQRQTALVAKQAAELDILSDGRLRLGVGVGWNEWEYRGMGVPFEHRGARLEDQVSVLRQLWSRPVVHYSSRFHRLDGLAICPKPAEGTIPIWIGTHNPQGFKRAGRIADGLVLFGMNPDGQVQQMLAVTREAALAAGRDPAMIGLDVTISAKPDRGADLNRVVEKWRAVGATHITVNTNGLSFRSIDEHIETLSRTAKVLGLIRA